MRLAPINNPHSKTGQVQKKTKAEERDEFIIKTKTQVIDKYSKRSLGNRFSQHKQNMTGSGANFQDKDDNFKLEERVSARSQSIKLMQEGYLLAFVDFFYITTNTTPSEIEPSAQLLEEYKLNKREKKKYEQTEQSLLALSTNLKAAEEYMRHDNTKKCLEMYTGVAAEFEELKDFETASYFYKKCLDVSIRAKYVEGEAQAYMGLGKCEEQVLNKHFAMENLETALEKATDGNLARLEKEISKELVRVYQKIAISFQEQNEFDKALQFFEKCLISTQKAENRDEEAKCYQQIGHIQEKLGNLEKAIEFLNKFLQLCEETGNKTNASEAHKQLAEAHSKNGNVKAAIEHLEALLTLANDEQNKQLQADAFLKLGLLYYQEGIVRKSVDCLQKHFELARADSEESKNQKLIDKARVNLGIAQANTMIENYKYLVLQDLNGLLDWKIKRQMKR